MSPRILIIIAIVVISLAVTTVVLGARRDKPADEKKSVQSHQPGFAAVLGNAFSWFSPKFDLAQVTITGATLQQRSLTLKKDQKITLTVGKDPDGDANSCRNLTLSIKTPSSVTASQQLVELTAVTMRPPLPKDYEKPDTGIVLPNIRLEPDPLTKKIDPERLRSCSLPFFSGGGSYQLEAIAACTVEFE